jgi:hypothetical protein
MTHLMRGSLLVVASALVLAAVSIGGCTSRYAGGEVRYVDDELPIEPTFADVRALKTQAVLLCDPRDTERFIEELENSHYVRFVARSKVEPPASARRAVFLAILRNDPELGGVIESWVSQDGKSGELGIVYRPRKRDGTVGLIGTWTSWTPGLVKAWSRMIENAQVTGD